MERWIIAKEYDDLSVEVLGEHDDVNDAVDSWSRHVAEEKVTGDPKLFVSLSVYGPTTKQVPGANDIPLLSWTSFEPHEALAWVRLVDGSVKHEGINIE